MSPARAGRRRTPRQFISLRARIGRSIQEQRVKRGFTQAQLAERADLSLKYLGEIERGEANVTIENLEILSRILEWKAAKAMVLPGPGLTEGVRLVLRMELRHITEAIDLILEELEPLAELTTPPRA